MPKSENIQELAKALCAMQTDLSPVLKDAEGQVGSRKYGYVTLGAIWAEIQRHMQHHNLSFVQLPTETGLKTIIMHTSGQWIEETSCWPEGALADAQKMGSAITYLRRYALCAALGIIAEEDDDGARASERSQPSKMTHQGSPSSDQKAEPASQPEKYWAQNEKNKAGSPPLAKENMTGEQMTSSIDKCISLEQLAHLKTQLTTPMVVLKQKNFEKWQWVVDTMNTKERLIKTGEDSELPF